MIMGYLEIHYEPECTGSVLTCIGLGYGKFLSDLAFTAETLFHERMSDLLEDLAEDYLEMPLLFSVELPVHMANLLGCLFRYTFLVMDREHFRQVCREYEIDKDIARKCLSRDTDCIVVYTGMTRIG